MNKSLKDIQLSKVGRPSHNYPNFVVGASYDRGTKTAPRSHLRRALPFLEIGVENIERNF